MERTARSTLRRLAPLAVLLGAACAAACGKVEQPAVDAPGSPPIDAADTVADAADDAATDGAITPVDAGPDAPQCAWITIAMCDSGGTIAQFCPTGTHVNQLRRCDGTTYVPDATYQQFHLCNCTFQTCGCSGVAWQEVECCN